MATNGSLRPLEQDKITNGRDLSETSGSKGKEIPAHYFSFSADQVTRVVRGELVVVSKSVLKLASRGVNGQAVCTVVSHPDSPGMWKHKLRFFTPSLALHYTQASEKKKKKQKSMKKRKKKNKKKTKKKIMKKKKKV